LKEKDGEVIKPHKNFRVFLTGNSIGCMSKFKHLYSGTNNMNAAFMKKFMTYKIDWLEEDAEIEMVSRYVKDLHSDVVTKIVEVSSLIRKAFEEETVSFPFCQRTTILWSLLIFENYGKENINSDSAIESAKGVILDKAIDTDALAISEVIRRVFG